MPKATSKGPPKRKGRPPGKAGEGSNDQDYVPDDEGSSGSEAERLRLRILEAEGRRLSDAEAGGSGLQDGEAEGDGDDENDDGDDEGDEAETEAARKKA